VSIWSKIDGWPVFVWGMGRVSSFLVRSRQPKPPRVLLMSSNVKRMARIPPGAISGWTGLLTPRASGDIGGAYLCCTALVKGRRGGGEGEGKMQRYDTQSDIAFLFILLPYTLYIITFSHRKQSDRSEEPLKRKRRDSNHVNDLGAQGGISEGEIERRRRMRAALELALLDRFRAAEVGAEALYDKAFAVLQRMETEPGGWIAAQVARLMEETPRWRGQEKRQRVSLHADEGRLVDWFLNDVNSGAYDA